MTCKQCDDFGYTCEMREGSRYVYECKECYNYVGAAKYSYGRSHRQIQRWLRELTVTHSE